MEKRQTVYQVQEEINWNMFEKVETLGNGSFGKVYKVKCLKTSKISNQDANKRISFIEQPDDISINSSIV